MALKMAQVWIHSMFTVVFAQVPVMLEILVNFYNFVGNTLV